MSLMEPFPRTMILQPVSDSSCLAVSPRGPKILPTKLNYIHTHTHTTEERRAETGETGHTAVTFCEFARVASVGFVHLWCVSVAGGDRNSRLYRRTLVLAA